MKKTTDISEEDLHAYVDKQLSSDKIEAVEALIANDPAVRKKVSQWKEQNRLLNALYSEDRLDRQPENEAIKDMINSARSSENKVPSKWIGKRRIYSTAASVFLVVAGAVLGWISNEYTQSDVPLTPEFVESAVSAHQVYSVEVLHPVEVSADEKGHLITWLSNRIEYPLEAPDIQDFGYTLLGGRLLSMQKGLPAAQLMYENSRGERVTLLVTRDPAFRDQQIHITHSERLNASYWVNSNVGYSITGAVKPDKLKDLSKSVSQQLGA